VIMGEIRDQPNLELLQPTTAVVTPRGELERVRAAATARNDQLLEITSALADAVSAEEVFTAVVDRLGRSIGASTTALWLVQEDGRTVRLARAYGYSPHALAAHQEWTLDGEVLMPAIDAIRRGEPIWIPSQAALLRAYPHTASTATPGRAYRVTCLPLVSNGRTLGALGITIDEAVESTDEERGFLLLVARYASQALERLRLLDAERKSRTAASQLHEEAQIARNRFEQLYRFAHAAAASDRLEQVFDAALDAIARALGTPRASILLSDDAGTMRFRAWRELSDEYRHAVDGHSPWPKNATAPEPVLVPDVTRDASLAAYLPLFERERIGSLAFIPLVTRGRLIGKFMVYHGEAHEYSTTEIELALAIANHLASVTTRFMLFAELERTVHDNELFAGVLAHDLRNPLGAITTAAQLLLMRQEGEGNRSVKPLSRILSSGQRITRMIDQLLDFTRARVGGGIAIQPRDADLADLCSQAVGELELVFPDRRIELSFAGDLQGVWDADRVLQIVSNLVANASQHGQPDGGIAVRADGTSADRVVLSVHNKGAIPAKLLPKLFDPFRGTTHRRDHSRGLGLGLYIVKELARAHGGSVEVASSEADGTTFTVRLPRRAIRG
ncbi:MAG TPA: GAF domain-containing sensor histidine kinase, partial [Kofleriaceae bacterium]|nr:GAF domain-containing sensor histidine kinase [Kofleriaceae bacterium]